MEAELAAEKGRARRGFENMIHLVTALALRVTMRGTDEASGSLFSYVDLEDRVPAGHPLRKIRQIVNDALASLDAEFDALWTCRGLMPLL